MKKISYSYERIDKRGIFREYLNGDECWKAVNSGIMKKSALLGNHYHKKSRSAFFLLSGSADFFIKNVKKNEKVRKFRLKSGEGILIYPYETHTIRFREKSMFLLLKSQKFDSKSNDLYEAKLISNG